MLQHRALIDRSLSVTSPRSIDNGVSNRMARVIRVDDPVEVIRNFLNSSRNASRIFASAAAAAMSPGAAPD